MTEAEWFACSDPQPMLETLRGKVSARKRRLFACACCRRICHLMADQRCRRAVEMAEAFADDLVNSQQLRAANQAARRAWLKLRSVLDRSSRNDPSLHDATAPAYYASIAAEVASGSGRLGYFPLHCSASAVLAVNAVLDSGRDAGGRERAAQAMHLRCIVGNPFRPVAADDAWLVWNDATVSRLARAIYDERRFENMPILADALEEAGCSEQPILAHCRSGGEHGRGCWLLDLMLGRS